MKRRNMNIKSATLWLILLLITNLFFAFLVWLSAEGDFKNFILMIVIFTVIVVFTGYRYNQKRQERQMELLFAFLASTEEETEQALLAATDKSWHTMIQFASKQIGEHTQIIRDTKLELQNYQEFIEAWVHEIKTPLSLATLVLDNHKEDMSAYVYKRMEHIRCVMSVDVAKILYYARLQSGHVDYKFERITVSDCIMECIENFHVIAEEKEINLQINLLPLAVITDKKVLAFMLSQLLGNAFKYVSAKKGIVTITTLKDTQEDGKIRLVIQDNGEGVPQEDIPFIFDKGFTGNHPNQKSATGMGLYFVKKYAKELAIEVKLGKHTVFGKGFEIELIFPEIV